MREKCSRVIFAVILLGISGYAYGACNLDFFECGGGECIPKSKHCDGFIDCIDGSDENNCHHVDCQPPIWFRCKNDQCIMFHLECDGSTDCLDGSDEHANCSTHAEKQSHCSPDEFMCLNKQCIKRIWLCDGQPDCVDGSDETIRCEDKIDCSDGYRCKNKHCIIKEFHCDGYDDCGDNSDEESCPTTFYSPDHCPIDQGYFLCTDQIVCISGSNVCDGLPHCFDKSDELNCSGTTELNETYCRSLGCSHGCHLAPQNHVNCTCNHGYKLAEDEKTCIDLDECKEYGFCHQRCKNLNGSFECSCDNGYVLQSDLRTCKASGGDALLLFSSYNRIRGIYLQSQVYFTVAKDLNHVIGISHNGHYVYWTDISHGQVSIVRATESGSDMEILVNSGLGVPEDLAVDYVTNNIYFTDRKKRHIGVCTETGMTCAVLNNVDIDKPRGIALYPQKGTMFWSDWGSVPMIATSGMDGSNPKALVEKDLKWPNGLALDISNERLYWVDAKSQTIETIRLDGTDREVVLRKAVKHPFSIAIFEDMLYWSDWENMEIQMCNKFTGKNHSTVVKEKKKSAIFGVHIYHPVHYPRVENPCENNRCSDICLLTPNLTYACACPEHFALGPDKHTCKMRSKPLQVVVGADNKIFLVSPEHLGRQYTTEMNLPDLHLIGCLAYDTLSESVLISDTFRRNVMRLNLNTKEITVLIESGLGHISSMSFDSYGNNLYMTDSERKRIDVWSMASSCLVNVYKSYNGDVPESIVVVPEKGIMFFAISRVDGTMMINRANMDGTQILPNIAGGSIHGPKISLTYDKRSGKIYWSDSDAEVIESMNIDGTGRHVVLPVEKTPVSVVAHNDLILWVRRNSPNLYSYDIYDSPKDYADHAENVFKMAIDDESYLSLAVVGERESMNLHPCQTRTLGGCSHACLVSSPDQGSCHCPIPLHLGADNRTCQKHAHCSDKQFKCRKDDICIANIQRCDGHKDCPGGEDEEDCDMYQCKEGQFKCANGQCLSGDKWCDSEFDCSDHSDEINCLSSCTGNNFQCRSGECIPQSWRCDSTPHCKDSSDENGCLDLTCRPNSFRCKTGTCLPASWECDSFVDCVDGSDEHENCHAPTCKPNELRCKNGLCVSRVMACDGFNDCGDGTDELNCAGAHGEVECQPDEIPCHISKSKCVPLKSRCNGTAECPRGEDEMDCSNCAAEEFQCKNMKCVYHKWVCDKENDCGDESDESPELCSHWKSKKNQTVAKCNDFRCGSGECLPLYLVCNNKKDCQDGSDEGTYCEVACKVNLCKHICTPTPVAGRCLCHDGYVLNSDGYSCTDIDECAEGRCSQLCTNTEGSFNCSCMPGYVLKSDMLSCKAVGEAMSYILSGADQVRRVTHDFRRMDFLLYEPGSQILGIEIDTSRKLFYWSSGINHRINVMSLDGKDRKYIIAAGQPGKLSLDWITSNMYYIDNSDYAGIRVCNMAEKKYADIVRVEQGFIISSLYFNPITGILYYSKVRPTTLTRPDSVILQYSPSTGNATILADSNVSWVSGFAFDHVRQYLYWSDLYNQVIEKIRVDGKERQIVFKADVHRPENLVFFEDSLYWLTKGLGNVRKCKIHGGHKGLCETVPFYIHDIAFLTIMQDARQPNVTNPCVNYCDASSLCLITSSGPSCICEDGTVVAKDKQCDASQMTLSNEITVSFTEGNARHYVSDEKPPLSGSSSAVIGILMTALIICIAFASCLYLKKRRSNRFILETIHFQNPSYGLSHVPGSYHPTELTPGEHQYENPTAKLVRHPDGKIGVLTREKEPEVKDNLKFYPQDCESDSDIEERMDMKANLIP